MNDLIVIKVGGGAGIDLDAVCADFASLVREGARAVLVHGGSAETDALAERLGVESRAIRSPSGHVSRRTDRAMLDVFTMACRGRINAGLVERLRRHGVDALGLSGMDGGLWTGARKGAIRSIEDGRIVIVRDDHSGRVERVNAALLNTLIDAGHTPVLSPPAWADEGVPMNIDADRAAAATASALGASALLLLSNVPGLLRDATDPRSLIRQVATPEALRTAHESALGRMKNKVLAAEEALAGGVGRVVIAGTSGERPVRAALEGGGTAFEPGAVRAGAGAPA